MTQRICMSAIGTKQTWRFALQISAYDPKLTWAVREFDTFFKLLNICYLALVNKHLFVSSKLSGGHVDMAYPPNCKLLAKHFDACLDMAVQGQ
jgi:hypothetical protein